MAPDWDNNDGTDWKDDGAPAQGNGYANGDDFASFNNYDDNGADNAGAGDDSCRNCGQSGHFARDCTEPRKMGKCFNCQEEGHSKMDCTKPRVFDGECRVCNEKGHRADDCPLKPKVCVICKMENDHDTIDCKNTYSIDLNGVPDLTEGQCWQKIKAASDDADMDDFKDALKCIQKACPELTYPALEKQLRARKIRFYIIALEKDIGGGYTNVDMQGEMGKKYAISYFKSEKCPRPVLQEKWPKDPEDNLARLGEAGVTLERGLEHCNNCEKFGHSMRKCDQDRVEPETAKIACALCGEDGHRVRDCTEERRKPREPRTCKICGSEDHIAKECDQKPAIECRNCGGDHMAKDCDQPRKLICNNCEKEGHHVKDCDQPRDWSKVTCRHCGEKGHASSARCKPGAVKKEDGADDENTATNARYDDFNSGGNNHSGGNNYSGGNEFSGADTGAGENGWADESPVYVAAAGGW